MLQCNRQGSLLQCNRIGACSDARLMPIDDPVTLDFLNMTLDFLSEIVYILQCKFGRLRSWQYRHAMTS